MLNVTESELMNEELKKILALMILYVNIMDMIIIVIDNIAMNVKYLYCMTYSTL